ncbi:MAG TPA: ATP-binding protein [Vicinamibacterales bacterium]|nr:ATP-binding protein [Vicinamibacterales bacterium]
MVATADPHPATSAPAERAFIPRWHRLMTIRARLAISYGVVIAVVLAVVTVAVGTVHARLGMARVDAELTRGMRSVAGVVNSEINERLDLAIGAHEALIELELPGVGVSVLDSSGHVLSTRRSGAPAVDAERLALAQVNSPPRTLEPERVRVAASSWQHGQDAYTVVSWMSLGTFDREHAIVMNTVRIAIPLAALAALTGGWLIVWRALRPLSVMAAHADAIDRRHLQQRLPLPLPSDELRRLAVAFNALLDRLSESVDVQRRFMADASHELRTPVTVARTAAQVTLSEPHRSEPEYREALDIVASQADRLTRVVDDMFLLALADVDGRPLLRRHLYLDEVVADCARAAGVLAESRGISITVKSPEGVQIQGDEELLRRMVMNLLDNAIRHSPDGERVESTVAAEGNRVTLSVQDAGPGIPAAAHERVFERFVRLETAHPTSGGGLGLPIARWIAEQHSGTLELESDSGGCRFVVTLPVHA